MGIQAHPPRGTAVRTSAAATLPALATVTAATPGALTTAARELAIWATARTAGVTAVYAGAGVRFRARLVVLVG
jgi:hypothetical protein